MNRSLDVVSRLLIRYSNSGHIANSSHSGATPPKFELTMLPRYRLDGWWSGGSTAARMSSGGGMSHITTATATSQRVQPAPLNRTKTKKPLEKSSGLWLWEQRDSNDIVVEPIPCSADHRSSNKHIYIGSTLLYSNSLCCLAIS